MTLIPDNLKRTGGRPFGDGEAPNRTASKPIIADSHYTFPILSGIYKNGRALAKVWSYTKSKGHDALTSQPLDTPPTNHSL